MIKDTHMFFYQFMHSWTAQTKVETMLGWAHPVFVHLLKHKKTKVFIDGTFRNVPHGFKQCVIVMVHDRATKCYMPVFFVLCPRQTHDVYWKLLTFVAEATDHQLDPEFVSCDFERGLINAVRDQFPDVDIRRCHFHFKQACRRKMKQCRLPDSEVAIAITVGVLDMLSVVPVHKIAVQGIRWVQRTIQDRCAE